MTFEALLQEALSLPDEQRATLVRRLSATLTPSASEEVEAAWASEIAKRVEDVRAGRAATIPAEQAISEIRESLRARRA